ncbi:hypothetical protein ECZU25_58550 [Escherichia coli]|nr:hypothetical protein ECZU25_58550 [Escherichia coli]
MNMKKTLLVILTGITWHHRWQVPPPAGRGPLPKPAAEPPGAGAHSQPGMVTAGE